MGIFGPKAEATSGDEDLTETGNRARKVSGTQGKSEACRERMCERDGREKGTLATDRTRFLATLSEDRFLYL